LIDAIGGGDRPILDLAQLIDLPGQHNWQNAACAYAACRALGLSVAEIVAGLRSFPGLPHRMERLGEIDGVLFVNDSKATNAEAAARALACFETIYWIAGGRGKAGGIVGLAPYFERIRHAFLIGEAAPEMAGTLEGRVACSMSGDLSRAVAAAHDQARAEARPGAVVLLSPACASFDQFADFEARGEAFRDAVRQLSGGAR
jgi:UDP-N-acetylmuramoylalanine--D-glutamate ligase